MKISFLERQADRAYRNGELDKSILYLLDALDLLHKQSPTDYQRLGDVYHQVARILEEQGRPANPYKQLARICCPTTTKTA